MKLNKAEFLDDLKCKLSSLPKEEREKTVNYYTEMIDDRIESGMGEEEAVAQMESTQTIAERLIPEESKNKTTSEKVFDFIDKFFTKHGYLVVLAILILSFPLWSPIVVGVLIFVGLFFAFLFAMIALGAICTVVALGIAISFITQSLLSALSALGVSMIFAGVTMLITIGTFKLIRQISDFCKRSYKGIKERSEKRRNSK